MDFDDKTQDYLRLLSKDYPSIQAASATIVELTARLNLPKPTEHFISDIHGEYEAFQHILKNGSGTIKRKITELFPDLSAVEQQNLASLIYYPEARLPLALQEVEDTEVWYRTALHQLVQLSKVISHKHTRAYVLTFLPQTWTKTIDALLYGRTDTTAQRDYYESIVATVITTGSAPKVIIALAELVQHLVTTTLHIIGDVYDRGPGAELVMDMLLDYHDVDIQWGNHDIVWMGAAAGSLACLANVIRISLRYTNTQTLEMGYGISLLPLVSFALETYGDDPCTPFIPHLADANDFTEYEIRLMAQMHKAITIIQLKLEAKIIQRRSQYEMSNRLLLDKIDYEKGTIEIEGVIYSLQDTQLPTIDPQNPYDLSDGERLTIDKLRRSFANSRRLQKHVRFLYTHGSMYKTVNGNLLYHGCIPMNEDGSFQAFVVNNQEYSAREYMDRVDRLARQGYFSTDKATKQYGQDAIWYLWSGAQSPLFGKDRMATFERYFIADKTTHTEKRNAYYRLRHEEATAGRILKEFGLDPVQGHIINGHVPVKVKKGESPIKADGRLIVIDGGFARAYQDVTGIAGYTLIFNSYGLLLTAHTPFETRQQAIEDCLDMVSKTEILERNTVRIRIRDTDEGHTIQRQIEDLELLITAYRDGTLQQ